MAVNGVHRESEVLKLKSKVPKLELDFDELMRESAALAAHLERRDREREKERARKEQEQRDKWQRMRQIRKSVAPIVRSKPKLALKKAKPVLKLKQRPVLKFKSKAGRPRLRLKGGARED